MELCQFSISPFYIIVKFAVILLFHRNDPGYSFYYICKVETGPQGRTNPGSDPLHHCEFCDVMTNNSVL